MTTFKGLLHKIDNLDFLKMKMKTKMAKKRKEMDEKEREVEEVITKKTWNVTQMMFRYMIHHNFHANQQD